MSVFFLSVQYGGRVIDHTLNREQLMFFRRREDSQPGRREPVCLS